MNLLTSNSKTFTLKTFYADFIINDYSYSWYDVDLKTLLGELYDKYNKFKICCNYISSGDGGALNNTNINIIFSLSGLDFLNYDVNTSGNTSIFEFATMQLNVFPWARNITMNGVQGQDFLKEETITELKISYKRVNDGNVDAGRDYPSLIFNFSIYPIE